METLTSKKFLEQKKVTASKQLESLLDDFAAIKIKEFAAKTEASVIAVKNINCDFESLRDMLDGISPGFNVEKDTFIFHSAAGDLYARLNELKKALSATGNEIVVNKLL